MSKTRFRYGRRQILSAIGAGIASVTVGCLSERGNAQPPENVGELGAPVSDVTVAIRSDPAPEFDPQIVHVTPGATVEWVVETGRHDVTAYHEDIRSFMYQAPDRTPRGVGPWRSRVLDGPGASYEHTFETEGVYDYVDKQQVCISHELAGNVGRVVVGWPDPDDEPAMEPPPRDLPRRVQNALEMFNEETLPVLEAGPDSADAIGRTEPRTHDGTKRRPKSELTTTERTRS